MSTEWRECRVKELVTAHFSGPSPTCEERQTQNDSEWGLLKTTAVTWEHGWDYRQHKVPPQRYWHQPEIEVCAGDVIVTKAGPRHRVGVVAHVADTPPRIMVSGKMIGLRPDQNLVVPRILAAALSTAVPQRFLDHRTTGMAESQVNFSNAILLQTPLRIPLLPEQRRIAEILDTLDETIRRTEQVIAKLQRMKQGLLHDLLTRGLDDNGELRDPERHPEQFKESPLGRIPKEWRVRDLQEATCAPICYGIVQVRAYVPNGVPVLAIKDLLGDFASGLNRTAESIDAVYARSRVEAGDVLISVKGTIGRIAVAPSHYSGNISRDIARLRPNAEIDPLFLCFLLRSPAGQRTLDMARVGTTRAELSIAPLKKLLFAFPFIDEQKGIAKRIQNHEDLISTNLRAVEKNRQLKCGLMDDLLTGRVRIPQAEKVLEQAM